MSTTPLPETDPPAADRRHTATDDVAARERRLVLALDAAQAGYWEWQADTDTLYLSATAAGHLGLDGGEQRIASADYLTRVHPDDADTVSDLFARLRHAGASAPPLEHVFRVVDAAGEARWIRACGAAERGADGRIVRIAGLHLDVSERQATESQLDAYRDELERRVDARTEALSHTRNTLAQIIDNSPVPTFVLDGEHRITHWNRACEHIIGLAADDMIGTTAQWRAFYPAPRPVLADLVMRDDHGGINDLYGAKVRPSAVVPGAFEAEDYFPSFQRWLYFTAAAIRDDDGRIVGAIETLQDITARKQAEIALHEAKAAAEGAARVKAEFLANMSHEIRTPLNAIIGFARMMQKGELAPRQREHLNRIRAAGDLLQQLIDNILDFSRIEAGKMPIERTAFVLDTLLDNLSSLVAERAREKGLELYFVVAEDVPQHLVGDSLRLMQVLVNLVGNAIKFTEQGQVLVFLSVAERQRAGLRLEVAVQDTGIGISEAQQARLFRAFSQADTSTTRKYGGTGLGLTICHRLVELMGGGITLSSEPGKGSTFLFQIPLGIGDATPAPARIGAGRRALVVDDNPIARTVLSRLLANLGYRTDTADSGAEALARLAAAGDDPYRLLFLDWNMPELNGVEVARRVRAEVSPAPQIVVVTSAGQSEAESAFADAEVQGLVQKPVSASGLAAALAPLAGDTPAAAVPPTLAPPARLRGLRVLVVDDVPTNRQIVGELLDDEGAQFAEAGNGRQALELLATDPRWDVVLMDVQMPELDGLETTRRLRADPRLRTLPVIAMTAFALEEEKRRCLAAGMNDFLTKPIEPEAVVATLAGLAAHRPSVPPPRPPAVAAGFPALPGIDTEDGLRRMMNKPAFYERMLKSFYERFIDAPATVRCHLAAGHPDDARREAHSAKGVSASVGAETVRATALALEQAIAAGRSEVDDEIDAFAAALETVFAGLRAQFGWATPQ